MANRADRIIKNKTEENMPTGRYGNTADRNVSQKETEKTLKYKALCIDIQQMWYVKCMIVLVITGTTEIVISLKGEFGSHTGKTFNRLTTDRCTFSIVY